MVVTTSLPPGFRFHPTDVELVWYYLKRKVIGKPLRAEVISEIDLYKFAPWDLPDKSCLQSKDLEWYFFCPQDRKYASGSRTNRSTDIGYWKITGRDRSILHDSRTVGFKKTLVFYVGTAPRRERTDWVMHEFRLEDKELVNAGFSQVQNVYVLCKIFQGSGPGPKNGKQYGAPFREEDWEDDVVSEKEISTPCLPCSSPRPLDDLVILSEPVLQQSVASGVAKLPSTPDIFHVDAILDQLIEDPDDSSHLSENANGESGSVMLHKSATEVSGVFTQDVPESENLCGQVEQEPNDIEEMFKSLGELEPIDNYYFSGNLDDEYTFQPMPLESGNEQYADVQDLRILWESDHFDLVVPHQLLDNKPFANFVSFRGINTNEFPNYSADINALSTSPGRFLCTGPDLLNDQSILIPEMDGPKEMDCQHKADMCPQNVCVSGAEEVGSFLVQNVAGGSSCKSLSCFDPSTDCYSDWENYSL